MSGLCGVVNFDGAPVEPEILARMARSSAHRGPDGIRYEFLGSTALAHLALNTTAEATDETQPLAGRGAWLVADARLDNREELIHELRSRGFLAGPHRTDAALILAAYHCWKQECAEHLLGDFAFVVWDTNNRRLLCVRDPMGVKPLHYSRAGPLVCVASEAQQLLQHPAVPRKLDEGALAEYLCGRDPAPGRTLFTCVLRLPPAHRLVVTPGGMVLERYWDVDPDQRTVYRDEPEYAEHFLSLFTRAVSDRLRRSSGTAAVAMSGGLDSCSVAAVAHRCLSGASSGATLTAFSFVFDRLKKCDESEYIDAMEREAGVEVVRIAAENHLALSDPMVLQPPLETPAQAWDPANREMNRLAKDRGVRVLLTGHGGDSLNCTNRMVYAARLRRGDVGALGEWARDTRAGGGRWGSRAYHYIFRPLAPQSVDRLVRRLSRRRVPGSPIPEWIPAAVRRRTSLADRLEATGAPRRFHDPARQHVFAAAVAAWSVQRAVYSRDRAAGEFGLEMRHPFLDRRLIEFVCSIPPEVVFRIGRYKPLLKGALGDLLPETVRLRRDKANLAPFVDTSVRREAGTLESLFQDSSLERMGLIDANHLGQALATITKTGVDTIDWRLWYAITAELWLRRHFVFSG